MLVRWRHSPLTLTCKVNEQLMARPNLDLKTSIIGLEPTLDMMCEVGARSPQVFLEAYQPLRFPNAARTIFNQVVQLHERPPSMAFGMIVTSLNIINIFTD